MTRPFQKTSFAALAVALTAAGCGTSAPSEQLTTEHQAETPDTFGVGSGRDQAFTVPAAGTIVNSYAAISAVDAGATHITIGAVHGAAAGFAADELILVWRTTGLATATSGDPTPVVLAGDVGSYEFARIKTVAAGVVTVTNPLSSATRFATGSQVVRVPEYTTLTIGATASLSPYPWDGAAGGIVAVFAATSIVNAGAIEADGAGFRGGGIENANVQTGCTSFDDWSNAMPCGGAHKGEGLFPSAFAVADPANAGTGPATTYGRGNYANGGGGGEAHNAGGGGGGHAGVGGMGGRTWVGDVTAGVPRLVGGMGGATLTYALPTRLAFGGGGGAGEENNAVGTSGGIGGGAVLVRTASFTGPGTVSAAGGDVTAVAGNDGSGGGGAGGAVLIQSQGPASCGSARANGGKGGSGGTDPDGPGGGGGGGYVLVQSASGTCPVGATAGDSGLTTTTTGIYVGTSYGATGGAAGAATGSAGIGFGGTVCTPAILGSNQCGGCVQSVDCPASTPVCDSTSNDCAACNGDFETSATHACPTSADPACVTTGAAAGSCVICVTSSDCSGVTPVCAAINTCAACNGDFGTAATSACPTTLSPYCESTGACGTCTSDASCASGHAGTSCDMASGACFNPPPDAGIDAGEADAAEPDAEESDAGIDDASDAGSDARASDAGVDSGSVDAGSAANAADAGTIDAGSSADASAADAGAKDASAVDASASDAQTQAEDSGLASDATAEDATGLETNDAAESNAADAEEATADASSIGAGTSGGTIEGGGLSCSVSTTSHGSSAGFWSIAWAVGLTQIRRRRTRRAA